MEFFYSGPVVFLLIVGGVYAAILLGSFLSKRYHLWCELFADNDKKVNAEMGILLFTLAVPMALIAGGYVVWACAALFVTCVVISTLIEAIGRENIY